MLLVLLLLVLLLLLLLLGSETQVVHGGQKTRTRRIGTAGLDFSRGCRHGQRARRECQRAR